MKNRRRNTILVLMLGCILVSFHSSAMAAYSGKEKKTVICIDPGHQQKGMRKLEPIGPGAKTKKAALSSGTRGVFTKKTEYQLNLEVSLKLRECLENMGYQVVMTRTVNEVTLSNIDRANISNDSNAELYVRIHANGSQNRSVNGFSVLYPSEKDQFTKKIGKLSKDAAGIIERQLREYTHAASQGIVPRMDLTGFNWSKVPTILVEMGFMTNVEEDKKLAEDNYQMKIAQGIANGILAYTGGSK